MNEIAEGDSEAYTSSYKRNVMCHKNEIHRVAKTVITMVITLYDDRWHLDLSC